MLHNIDGFTFPMPTMDECPGAEKPFRPGRVEPLFPTRSAAPSAQVLKDALHLATWIDIQFGGDVARALDALCVVNAMLAEAHTFDHPAPCGPQAETPDAEEGLH